MIKEIDFTLNFKHTFNLDLMPPAIYGILETKQNDEIAKIVRNSAIEAVKNMLVKLNENGSYAFLSLTDEEEDYAQHHRSNFAGRQGRHVFS